MSATPPATAPVSVPAAGSSPPEPKRRVVDGAREPVLPDLCNLGIALRVLVPANVGAVLLVAMQATSLRGGWHDLIAIAAVLEPVLIGSLVVLCALRRIVNGRPRPLQWVVGLGVPAGLTVLAAGVAAPILLPDATPVQTAWWVGARAVVAAALAWGTIEVFALRARAYSPSLSEARLQALQARIRPHFLFNSLNTVLGLMRRDPRRAERTLENLADLFRVFMRDTRELVPLDEEVITCREYLAIEQLRLGDRLSFAWQVDPQANDALLPSLLLQPLVENAVHHGIEPNPEPGHIDIAITRPGERVRVEIVNPAATSAPVRPGNQMALSNVRERLMLLYDVEAELKTAVEGARFRLCLEFPYRKERRRRDGRRTFDPDR